MPFILSLCFECYSCMSDDCRYITLAHVGEGIYKDRGSRFLGFAFGVSGVEDALGQLERYRKKYHDARHVCWAYYTDGGSRQSDDGEPAGTAGAPIANVLSHSGLRNVMCVVVRYFGGVLLGTGGLVVAYREAARLALDKAERVERVLTERRTLSNRMSNGLCDPKMIARVYQLQAAGTLQIVDEQWQADGSVVWTLDVERGFLF